MHFCQVIRPHIKDTWENKQIRAPGTIEPNMKSKPMLVIMETNNLLQNHKVRNA